MSYLAYTDIRTRRIPNGILLAMLVTQTILLIREGIVAGANAGPKILSCVIAAVFWLIMCYILYVVWHGNFGAGDAKFITVTAFFVGMDAMIWLLMCALLLMGGYAVVRRFLPCKNEKGNMPLVPFLAVGLIGVYIVELFGNV